MTEIPISVMPWHRPDPCKPLKMQTEAVFQSTYLDYLTSLKLDSPPLSSSLTRIVCSIGPASNNIETMMDLMEKGMVIALVPLSLGTREEHITMITNLRSATTTLNKKNNRVFPLAIAVETKGPGLRIGGLIKDQPVELPLNHKVILTTDKTWRTMGTEHYIYIAFPDMCQTLRVGDVLLVGNGPVILEIELIDQYEADCKVVGAGTVHSHMTVAIPYVPLRLPPLTDADEDDLRMAASMEVDIVVASRTQSATHVKNVRQILAQVNTNSHGEGVKVWAQLETKQALDNLDSIVAEADAVVLSRVSLTQDIVAEKLFLAQKLVVGTCIKARIPVYITSHFLPSMQAELTPSVAELADVSCAVLDGVDGFILRNTTSVGKHPELTVKTLKAICLEAEAAVWQSPFIDYLNSNMLPPTDPTYTIASSAVDNSLKSGASAIIVTTTSGHSAKLLAHYRPRCPIIAITRFGQVARQLNTWRAVVPLHYVDAPLPDWTREIDVRLQFGIEYGKEQGIIKPGDPLVLMNGFRHGAGFANTIRVVYASESFPWVYAHRLPPEIPTDSSQVERRISLPSQAYPPPAFSLGASFHARPRFNVGHVAIRVSHHSAAKTSVLGKTLEERFQVIHSKRSKEIQDQILESSGEPKKASRDLVSRHQSNSEPELVPDHVEADEQGLEESNVEKQEEHRWGEYLNVTEVESPQEEVMYEDEAP